MRAHVGAVFDGDAIIRLTHERLLDVDEGLMVAK